MNIPQTVGIMFDVNTDGEFPTVADADRWSYGWSSMHLHPSGGWRYNITTPRPKDVVFSGLNRLQARCLLELLDESDALRLDAESVWLMNANLKERPQRIKQ